MNTEIRVDTVQLSSHTEFLREEYRYAQELYDNLRYVRARADDYELCRQLAPLIKKAEYLSRRSVLMREALEETGDIFERLIREISTILNDSIALGAQNLE